jgi:hypothetical protein
MTRKKGKKNSWAYKLICSQLSKKINALLEHQGVLTFVDVLSFLQGVTHSLVFD